MTSTADFPFAALDALVSGTIYFRTEAARDAYVADNHYAQAVVGSPASRYDHFINR